MAHVRGAVGPLNRVAGHVPVSCPDHWRQVAVATRRCDHVARLPASATRQRSIALLALGLLAATGGYVALLAHTIVIDRSMTVDAAHAALDDPEVRTLLVRRTTDAVTAQLVGETASRALAPYGIDVTRDLRPVAAGLVGTPEFTAAYVEAIGTLHDRVFVDPDGAVRIDVTALAARARADAIEINPAYGELISQDAHLVVDLPAGSLPDLSWAGRVLTTGLAAALLALGAVAVVAGVARDENRARGVRRVAAWALTLGGLQVGLCLLADQAVDRVAGDTGIILRPVADLVLPRLVVPALGLLVIGAGLRFVALRVEHVVDARLAADGRAAFWTDENGQPTEWAIDGRYEPEVLRTAPGTATFHR